MNREQIKEKTRTFLHQYISQEIPDDEDLFSSGLVNSLIAMQLVMFVEKEFGISVENEDLDLKNFNAVDAIADFVGRKTGLQ